MSGLDRDFRGEPFLATAEIANQVKIERLLARCAICGEPADLTQRLVNGKPAPYDNPIIMIGGSELYEPRCHKHHVVPGWDKPEERIEQPDFDDLLGTVDVSRQLERWIDRLQAIARTGLGYTLDGKDQEKGYDQERYENILKLAAEMKAFIATRNTPLDVRLADEFYANWRTQVRAGQSYVTPRVTVAGAVFDDEDRILLVRRKGSPFWDLPGGWCDIGYSPAEVAIKEIDEESGLRTTPTGLVGVYDSQWWGFLSPTPSVTT